MDFKFLHMHSPILGGLISAMPSTTDVDKRLITDLCSFLINSLKSFYDCDDNENIEKVSEDEHLRMLSNLPSYYANDDQELLCMWNTGSYFPGRRICNKMKEVHITKESMNRCNKIAKKRGTMGPGVLWFFCGTHEKAIGFIILYNAESCKIVTETLIAWFQRAPKIVIYDNACNLEEYISNRYSKHFKDTTFYVDAFHYKSHVNCAPTYDSGLYKEKLKNVNTSLLEQKNSRIRYIKPTAPYLKARTFMAKLRYTVLKLNANQ